MTTKEMKGSDTPVNGTSSKLGSGNWTILFVLVSLLGLTVFVAYIGWTFAGDADVPESGYVALALGVVLSLAVGFGLMTLVFYSSRKGFDEPPILVVRDEDDVIALSRKSKQGCEP